MLVTSFVSQLTTHYLGDGIALRTGISVLIGELAVSCQSSKGKCRRLGCTSYHVEPEGATSLTVSQDTWSIGQACTHHCNVEVGNTRCRTNYACK